MAIELDSISHSIVTASGATFSHTCTGNDLALLVSVSMIPTNDEEVSSVKYNGSDLSLLEVAQIENKTRTELWYVLNPTTGENDVEVSVTDSTEILSVAGSYTGIAQTDAVYNLRSGAGKMVDSLGIKSFSQVSGIAIGCGAVDNSESHIDALYGSQVEDWDFSGTTLRSEAVSAQLTFDNDNISIPNKLTKKANYAIIIVGLAGA